MTLEDLQGSPLLDLPREPVGQGLAGQVRCDPALRESDPDLRGAPPPGDPGAHETLRESRVIHESLSFHSGKDRGGDPRGCPAAFQAIGEFSPAVGTAGEQSQDVGEDLRFPLEGTRVPTEGHGAAGAGADSDGTIVTEPVTGS